MNCKKNSSQRAKLSALSLSLMMNIKVWWEEEANEKALSKTWHTSPKPHWRADENILVSSPSKDIWDGWRKSSINEKILEINFHSHAHTLTFTWNTRSILEAETWNLLHFSVLLLIFFWLRFQLFSFQYLSLYLSRFLSWFSMPYHTMLLSRKK